MAETRNISVELSSDIVYVTGSVNGVDKTFTLIDGLWQTEADRSENDIYYVSITAVNNLGTISSIDTVIYYGLHLITDRTKNDVLFETEKGFYNYTDLNRVESAAEYVAARLTGIGCCTTLYPKTLWDMEKKPTSEEMKRYLANIYICVRQLGIPSDVFNLPQTMNSLDYMGANNIEKCLEMIDLYISNMQKQQLYSGTIYAGEEW